MTKSFSSFLRKADLLLADAQAMPDAGFVEAAGRNAYLAGYHAAQSLVAATNGKPAKTHDGVKSEFARLTKDVAHFPDDLRSFLFTASRLKEIADYELGA